jgi:hypothetical protein
MANRSPGALITSKAGVKSLAKKMDTSRHAFGAQPAARKKEGAFGHETGTRGSRHRSAAGTSRPGKRAAMDRVRARGRT